ncbi:hypothetical protein C5167_012450 [Papaver somniferum]|uniref:Protein kinase domain-containing protein n=1 Tax=Papaver somniferum TaxID=3469 RepID=A0A4Y7J1S2_PAPSO|nr:probable inactive receptor kinase At2g26730 [Papaver somniferum]RZC53595.1 hypothetical protein C5167_012450 [Papaver somniferum]
MAFFSVFSVFSVLILLLSNGRVIVVDSEPSAAEKNGLLSFLNQTPHENRLKWNASDSVCNWVGIECDSSRSYVYSLRLPGTGLVGSIPPNTLGNLNQLRVLSLRANRLSGPIPSDFSNLKLLRSVYLQNNVLSGEFPVSLTASNRLNRLVLSSNNFTGKIPFAVNNLTHLSVLDLDNNGFSGTLPSIDIAGLQGFNVSNNKLNGSIPETLEKFPASSFSGNLDLCGGPLKKCQPFFQAPSPSPEGEPSDKSPSKKSKKLSKAAIIAISVVCGLILLALLAFLLLCCLRKRKKNAATTRAAKPPVVPRSAVPVTETGTTSSSKDEIVGASSADAAGRNKLVFLDGGVYSFDLEDLLRASAEVLGKGSVGTSYKAVLEEGTTVVVKRLKDVVVSKKEFEAQMDVLGKVKHDNIVPLRAYYFSKDEKLLVQDFMAAGSLSALLHGSRGSGRTPLDWGHRMKIALGTARGLSHLHVSGKVPHGNIKSSNILLRSPEHEAGISDYGLNPLFGTATPPNRIAGYRAPEVVETRKVTFKSDVYSFGVLLLELLTGKAPNQASLGEEGIDLPRWVQSVVREEWTAEVFDVELMRYHNIEEEMVQLLQIAMACVSTVPDSRPGIGEVLRMMEDMNSTSSSRGGETDDGGLRQSSDEPSKSGGHTPPAVGSRTPPSSVTP